MDLKINFANKTAYILQITWIIYKDLYDLLFIVFITNIAVYLLHFRD